MSECRKQGIEVYRYDWVGVVMYMELCKRLNFDNTAKQYVHKLESVPQNKMHTIIWDFEK